VWGWSGNIEKIRSLSGRLGFTRAGFIEFLNLHLDLRDGSIFDLIRKCHIGEDSSQERFIKNSIYFILTGYSEADYQAPVNRLIIYKQLRGAKFGDFDNKASRGNILKLYHEHLEKFRESIHKLGGNEEKFSYGDFAFKINSLPLVPMTFVLTDEDDEYPGDSRIFYDETIEHYLDVERINFLTILTVTRIGDVIRNLGTEI
jgi:hypothetical protein